MEGVLVGCFGLRGLRFQGLGMGFLGRFGH